LSTESQHILATLVDDLPRNLTLTTHGIDGNEATGQFQKLQQLGKTRLKSLHREP